MHTVQYLRTAAHMDRWFLWSWLHFQLEDLSLCPHQSWLRIIRSGAALWLNLIPASLRHACRGKCAKLTQLQFLACPKISWDCIIWQTGGLNAKNVPRRSFFTRRTEALTAHEPESKLKHLCLLLRPELRARDDFTAEEFPNRFSFQR